MGFFQSAERVGMVFRMGYMPIFLFLVMDLHALLEKTLNGLGYELVDLGLPGRNGLLRVFIDTPEGVNIDDCETVSRHLVRLLEVENVDYDRLEVSSPGLDRPLRKIADFARFAGERVRIRLCAPHAGARRNFQGELLGLAEDGKVRLRLDADDIGAGEGDVELDFNAIEKARLVPDFGRQPVKRR
jgi:ribosome maturation factor RimP